MRGASDALIDTLEAVGRWFARPELRRRRDDAVRCLDDLSVEGVGDSAIDHLIATSMLEQLQLMRTLGLDVLDAAGQALL